MKAETNLFLKTNNLKKTTKTLNDKKSNLNTIQTKEKLKKTLILKD